MTIKHSKDMGRHHFYLMTEHGSVRLASGTNQEDARMEALQVLADLVDQLQEA